MSDGSAEQARSGDRPPGTQISPQQAARLAREARALRDNLHRRKAAGRKKDEKSVQVGKEDTVEQDGAIQACWK